MLVPFTSVEYFNSFLALSLIPDGSIDTLEREALKQKTEPISVYFINGLKIHKEGGLPFFALFWQRYSASDYLDRISRRGVRYW
jgi:hypothetical protein